MNYKKGIIDTNILVHAYDEKSEYNEKAENFLEKIALQRGVFLTPQIILEFYNVLVGLGSGPVEAVKAAASYRESKVPTIIYPQKDTYYLALKLARRYNIKRKSHIFDAYLAATAIDNGVGIIYTQNTVDFKEFRKLQAVNPLK